MRIPLLFCILWVCPALLSAQHPVTNTVEAGRVLFQKSCAGCHGENAKGGRGPDLTTGNWRHGGSDEDLSRNITKGIPGTQMPPFLLPEAEVQAMITFGAGPVSTMKWKGPLPLILVRTRMCCVRVNR